MKKNIYLKRMSAFVIMALLFLLLVFAPGTVSSIENVPQEIDTPIRTVQEGVDLHAVETEDLEELWQEGDSEGNVLSEKELSEPEEKLEKVALQRN